MQGTYMRATERGRWTNNYPKYVAFRQLNSFNRSLAFKKP